MEHLDRPQRRRENSMISLTREDWSEIFYALESKSLAVRQGQYGSEDASGADAKWIGHLDELREKIGPTARRPQARACVRWRLTRHAPNLCGHQRDWVPYHSPESGFGSFQSSGIS